MAAAGHGKGLCGYPRHNDEACRSCLPFHTVAVTCCPADPAGDPVRMAFVTVNQNCCDQLAVMASMAQDDPYNEVCPSLLL